MELLDLTPENSAALAERVAEVMSDGGLCCFPTDTVYGIGGRAFSRKVLSRLMEIKPDRNTKPTAVLIDSIIRMSQCAADVPGPRIVALAEKFWPGALTMIWKVSNVVDAAFLPPDRSLGYRIPDSPFLTAVMERVDSPLWATSANLPGGKAPGLFSEIAAAVLERCDLVVRTRELLRGRASTVVDVRGKEPVIVRPGAIHADLLLKVWKSA